jgi:hypothetical protein
MGSGYTGLYFHDSDTFCVIFAYVDDYVNGGITSSASKMADLLLSFIPVYLQSHHRFVWILTNNNGSPASSRQIVGECDYRIPNSLTVCKAGLALKGIALISLQQAIEFIG